MAQQLEIEACRETGLPSEDNIVYPVPMVGEEPATEFRLLPVGNIQLADGPVFRLEQQDVEPIVSAFNARGNDFHGDYEHASELRGAEIPPGGAPASCRATLEARSDGIWVVNCRWTPRAREYLKNGEYWAFSPVFGRTEDGRIVSVRSFALTNDPRINNLHPLVRCKVVPFHEYPLDDSDEWDGDLQRKKWRKACSSDGSGDWDTVNKDRYAAMFAYVRNDGERPGDFLLPHHSVFDGKLRTSKRGVEAAAAAIDGARGGARIPEADLAGVKRHLADHYMQWHEKAPWDRTEEQAKADAEGFYTRNGRSRSKHAVSVVAAFNRAGHYLLGKRADSGKWAYPGGHAERGETPIGTAIRELHEETGLHPLHIEQIGTATAPGGAAISIHRAMVDGTPTPENDPDHEFTEYRWIDPAQELPGDIELHHANDVVGPLIRPTREQAKTTETGERASASSEEKPMNEEIAKKMDAAEEAAKSRHTELMGALGKSADGTTAMCKSVDALCSSVGEMCKAMKPAEKPTADKEKEIEAAKRKEQVEICRAFCDANVGPGFTKSDALQVVAQVESGAMGMAAAQIFVTAKRTNGTVKSLVEDGTITPPVVTFGFAPEIVEQCKREAVKAKDTYDFTSRLAGDDVTPKTLDQVTIEVCASLGTQVHKNSLGEVVLDFDPAKVSEVWKKNQARVALRKARKLDETYVHRSAR